MTTPKIICLWLSVLAAGLPQLTLADKASPLPKQQDESSRLPLEQQGLESVNSISAPDGSPPAKRPNLRNQDVSQDVRATANWVVDSGDNQGLPFMLVDKREARVLVFAADGQLTGTAPALIGMAVGDESVPGIGQRPLSSIRPDERTTPAGRFVASLGRNIKGREILWIDYEQALSLHPVVAGTAKERRAERLASPHWDDNRISFGCINVPQKFYTDVVSSTFRETNGIVYVLPETRPIDTEFASYYEVE